MSVEMSGEKRTGSPVLLKGSKRPIPAGSLGGEEHIPHYTPDQLLELVKILKPERSDEREIKAAAEIFATLGEPYKEVFKTFRSRSLEYYPEDAEKLWEETNRGVFKSCAEAIKKLLGWGFEDNDEAFRAWLAGNVPKVVFQKYKEGDRGLAEIAGLLLRDTVKASIVTGKRVYYLYDDAISAWSKTADCEVKRLVSHALEGVLLKVLDNHLYEGGVGDGTQGEDGSDSDEEGNKGIWKTIMQLVAQVRGSGKMGSVLALAQDLFVDEEFVASLDSSSHLLGVLNGVVDLRSGDLRARTKEDMISTIVPVRYDPGADDPWLRETISGLMADDEEMVKYLQRLLGYCITGDVSEDVFIIFTNSGSNGKDVIMGGLQALLGDFYRQMDTDIIVGRGGSRSNAKSKKGIGGRIWSFSETDENERFNASTVKQLSGGNRHVVGMDDVAARQKCILTTNHIPLLGVVNQAMLRRILIVKFPVTFRTFADGEAETKFERKRDPSLRSRFLDHNVGFLKWLVDGAVAWYAKNGLKEGEPKAVVDAGKEYFQSQDLVSQFIDARCEIGKGLWVLTDDFVSAYNTFFAFESLSSRDMSRRMEGKPFVKKQVSKAGNRLAYHGLCLKEK